MNVVETTRGTPEIHDLKVGDSVMIKVKRIRTVKPDMMVRMVINNPGFGALHQPQHSHSRRARRKSIGVELAME
jgi:hypothetical protein